MTAVVDKEFESGIHEVGKGEDVMGRQTELESGQHEADLASIERVERVYRYVILSPAIEWARWTKHK